MVSRAVFGAPHDALLEEHDTLEHQVQHRLHPQDRAAREERVDERDVVRCLQFYRGRKHAALHLRIHPHARIAVEIDVAELPACRKIQLQPHTRRLQAVFPARPQQQ